jgi:hypothetical protein
MSSRACAELSCLKSLNRAYHMPQIVLRLFSVLLVDTMHADVIESRLE